MNHLWGMPAGYVNIVGFTKYNTPAAQINVGNKLNMGTELNTRNLVT